ncbi:hypothetical protein ASPACDRAFT_44883 [Aspergillus aculeatus ATCC 16872]|uniref:Uncharacterized protein n=1 Tax=Aspergillus aculeatus (strain ATCC 16872 / CBS 172.66 / WB 5094) TaxID=690307 RepID=A0A1L9WQG6_ASPA1|nr:uncharacterized protein ASPACDRAFT_44883 [Aspergillus aculeatus ATCC 16872]OJJ98380.1 hypothetical protein ASPACDRAFT_44883 [Aspergillus aculeatus ATCC 16872]
MDNSMSQKAVPSNERATEGTTAHSGVNESVKSTAFGSLGWLLNGLSNPKELPVPVAERLRQTITESDPTIEGVTIERLILIRKALVESKTAVDSKSSFVFLDVAICELVENKDETPECLLGRAVRIFKDLLDGNTVDCKSIAEGQVDLAAFRAQFRHANNEIIRACKEYHAAVDAGVDKKEAMIVYVSKAFDRIGMATLHLLRDEAKGFYPKDEAAKFERSIASLDNFQEMIEDLQILNDGYNYDGEEPGWVKV